MKMAESQRRKLFNFVKTKMTLPAKRAMTMGVWKLVRTREAPVDDDDTNFVGRYKLDGRLARDIQSASESKLPDVPVCKHSVKSVNKLYCKCSDCLAIIESYEDFKQTKLTLKQKSMNDYAKVLTNMEKLKNIYFAEFLHSLHDKMLEQEKILESQGKKIPALKQMLMSMTNPKKSNSRQEQDRESNTSAIPEKFLEEVVRVQRAFIDDGKIKTQADMDEFWVNIQDPEFQKLHLKTSNYELPPLDMKNIPFNFELSVPEDEDHWAVVQAKKRTVAKKPQKLMSSWHDRMRPKGSNTAPRLKGRKNDLPAASFKQPSYLESKPFPQLYCLRKKSETKIDCYGQKMAEIAAKEQERKRTRRMVEKMYQLALANQILTNKLLKRHENDLAFSIDTNGAKPYDILQQFPSPRTEQVDVAEDAPKMSRSQRPRTVTGILKSLKRMSRDDLEESTTCDFTLEDASPPLVPLNMGTLTKTSRMIESKLPSSLWVNYTRGSTFSATSSTECHDRSN